MSVMQRNGRQQWWQRLRLALGKHLSLSKNEKREAIQRIGRIQNQFNNLTQERDDNEINYFGFIPIEELFVRNLIVEVKAEVKELVEQCRKRGFDVYRNHFRVIVREEDWQELEDLLSGENFVTFTSDGDTSLRSERDDSSSKVITSTSSTKSHDDIEQDLALMQSFRKGYRSFLLKMRERLDELDTSNWDEDMKDVIPLLKDNIELRLQYKRTTPNQAGPKDYTICFALLDAVQEAFWFMKRRIYEVEREEDAELGAQNGFDSFRNESRCLFIVYEEDWEEFEKIFETKNFIVYHSCEEGEVKELEDEKLVADTCAKATLTLEVDKSYEVRKVASSNLKTTDHTRYEVREYSPVGVEETKLRMDILQISLINAASEGYLPKVKEVAQQLLQLSQSNCNPNTLNHQNKYGDTAIMRAAIRGHQDVLKMLVEFGADVNIQNEHGNTAMMMATCNGHEDIVKMLVKFGADVNIQNKDGDTAIDLATRNDHKDIVQMLREISRDSVQEGFEYLPKNIDILHEDEKEKSNSFKERCDIS